MICYKNFKKVKKLEEKILVLDKNIKGMDIDIPMNYLYYFTSSTVTVLDLKSRISKNIIQTKNTIYFMAVNSKGG